MNIRKTLLLQVVFIYLFALMSGNLIGQDKENFTNLNRNFSTFYYAGFQQAIFHGSRTIYNNPDVKDSNFPGIDSIIVQPGFSFHSGFEENYRVFNKLKVSLGGELNLRKNIYNLFQDSVKLDGTKLLPYDLQRNLYYDIEIPVTVKYNYNRLNIGAGFNFILLENKVTKNYTGKTLHSKYFSQAFFTKPLHNKIIYPSLQVEYSITNKSPNPIWLCLRYEFENSKSSIVYLNFKILLFKSYNYSSDFPEILSK